jgi:hypothetical protein
MTFGRGKGLYNRDLSGGVSGRNDFDEAVAVLVLAVQNVFLRERRWDKIS